MRHYSFVLFALSILMLGSSVESAHAQSSQNAVYRFLQLTASPRAAALGGSHAAIPNADVSFFHINPAYIHEGLHRNFSVNYLNHIGDLNMGFVNGAWHSPRIGTMGFGIRFINYGDFTRRDESGAQTGDFSASDLAFSFGVTREVLDGFRLGVSTTLIYSSYAEYSSSAIGFNAGLRYFFEEIGIDVGASINNIGAQLSSFDDTSEPLPLDIRLSISRQLDYLPIRFNITAHSLDQWEIKTQNDESDPGFSSNLFRHLTFGAELSLSENVKLRAGYDHLQHDELKINNRLDTAGFGFGLGIRYRGITFDFSRNSFSELGGVTRIGIQTFL